MEFRKGPIEGIRLIELAKHLDARGVLVETYRIDELPKGMQPVMSYVSYTEPDVARGPHEHARQADLFVFLGPSNFKIWLWDNRRESPSYCNRVILYAGEDRPLTLFVPPGVVHAYRNISRVTRGMVLNYPDALYAGWGKKDPVDEIRHEDDRDVFYEDFTKT